MSEELRKAPPPDQIAALVKRLSAWDAKAKPGWELPISTGDVYLILRALSTTAAPQEPYGWVTSRGTFTRDRRQMEANPDLEWTALYATPAAPVPRDTLQELADMADAYMRGDATRTMLVDSVENARSVIAHAAPRAQPVAPAAPVPREPRLLASHRREIEQAIQEAKHPRGMSTHDGKARVSSALLRILLANVAAAPRAQPVAQEDVRAADVLRRMLGNQTVTDGELQSALNAAIRSLTSARTDDGTD